MDAKNASNIQKTTRYSPKLLSRARKMRHEPTLAERLVWSKLRDRQICGLKFRRQVPFGNYIADFYCPDAHLIVELDGDSHDGREKYDRQRTEWLGGRQTRVMRFTNFEVFESMDAVLEEIARACGVDI